MVVTEDPTHIYLEEVKVFYKSYTSKVVTLGSEI